MSWVSQILKRLVAWFPNQHRPDSFWIAAKPTETSQSKPNPGIYQLSRNNHSCSLSYSVGNNGRMKISQLVKACVIYLFLFPLSCSSFPIDSQFHSLLLALQSSWWEVDLPSPLCISYSKVQFMLTACRSITFNSWSKVLLTLSIINPHRFWVCFFNEKCLEREFIARRHCWKHFIFRVDVPWLYQCPFAVTMLLGSGATCSLIYGLGFWVRIRVIFPNVWVCRRHPNGSLTWKALIVLSFPLLNYLSGPSHTGEYKYIYIQGIKFYWILTKHVPGEKKKTIIPWNIQPLMKETFNRLISRCSFREVISSRLSSFVRPRLNTR